jgi:hypothetical protein
MRTLLCPRIILAALMISASSIHSPLMAQTPLEAGQSLANTITETSRAKKMHIVQTHMQTRAADGLEVLSSEQISIDIKSVANGLTLAGNSSFNCDGTTCTMRVDRINNSSSNRTTGTLRLELWATTNQTSRGSPLSGYILAVGNNLGELRQLQSYTGVVSTASQRQVPAGTYWITLVLGEYDSSCTSSNDRFCVSDSIMFSTRQTFGGGGGGNNPPPTTGSPQLAGNVSYNCNGSSCTINADRVNNPASNRTTGTMRLELWASSSRPSTTAGVSGYKVTQSSVLGQLGPNQFYSGVSQTGSQSTPPQGVYWVSLVLTEFQSTCSSNGGYCVVDLRTFDNQWTVGGTTPPPPPPPPPTNTFVTAYIRSLGLCYENLSLAVYNEISAGTAGWQSAASTTTCSSVGIGFYVGILRGSTDVRVYTTDAASAQVICNGGTVTGCSSNPPNTTNYTDLWWNPSESGWGVSITHRPASGVAFVAWYTYDINGVAKWYVGPDCRMASTSCTSTLYETSGPPMGNVFNPTMVSVRAVGTISLSFQASGSGTMSYFVNGISGTKSIQRQPF